MDFQQNEFGQRLLLSREEQEKMYQKNISDLLNPQKRSFILDNLEFFPTYECNWIDYSNGNGNKKRFKKNPLYKKELKIPMNASFNMTDWLYH